MLLDHMSHDTHEHAATTAHDPGSVRDITRFILDRNREQSAQFCNAAESMARRQYRSRHPTEIVALKCMDGRLNLSVMTEVPVGILQPYRNIGGEFNLGWPYLGELMGEWVTYGIKRGRDCLVLATYHYSKGDPHRGCKGFGYDTDAARAAAAALVSQYGRVFGKPYTVVHPILVGLETDEDALVFHSEEGDTFFVADHVDLAPEELRERFAALYPMMRDQVLTDLLELVKGNQRHIRKIRKEQRKPIDLDHREQVIAVGRGLDWLHQPNLALIIGPYPGWEQAVVTAGNIVLDNMKRGQLDADAEILLLISAQARERQGGFVWNLAVEKARFVAEQAQAVLLAHAPALFEGRELKVLSGVTDVDTRLLHCL